jgi:DNA invertase Pin-like site-specific DNA recombinase
MKILRCISWTAVSSEEQGRPGKISLSDQRQSTADFIAAIPTRYPGYRGMVVAELEVQGSRRIIELSEAIATHDAYAKLYEAIKARTFDVLVVARWDRLGREESLLITIRDLCISNNIAVAVTGSPPPTLEAKDLHNDEGWRIAGTVQAWGSGREDREISRRVRTGRRNSVLNNKNFLVIGYGYRYEYDADGNRSTVVDEAAATVLRYILIDLYLGREMGRPAIAKQLNAERIPTPRGDYLWNSGTVEQHVTRRWILAGYMEYGRFCDQPIARVKGNHPAIITEEELQRLELEVSRRQQGPRRIYAFSGIAWCTGCNRPMPAEWRKATDRPSAYGYLRCRTCRHSIRESVIAEELRYFFEYLLSIEDISQFIVDDDHAAAQSDISRRLTQIEDRLAAIANAVNRLLDAYELGTLPQDTLSERVQARQREATTLQAERANLQLQMTALQQTGPPQARAEEVRSNGLAILADATTDPGKVRTWLRDRVRVLCMKGEVTDIILV